MPTPNAAALGKYGDIPVNLHTGIPQIGVPLHTVSYGALKVPISLSYHAAGVRVYESASSVGLGWSLNAGGAITRTVMGLPDDQIGGYYYEGHRVGSGTQAFEDVANGVIDGETDIFSFNVGGYSGKFYFDKDRNYHFVPKQDLVLEFDEPDSDAIVPGFNRFTLITPDGKRYHFGRTPDEDLETGEETYPGVEVTVPGEFLDGFNGYNSSWYLVQVESADRLYHIDLEYEKEYYGYFVLASCYTKIWNSSSAGGSASAEDTECSGNWNPVLEKYVNATRVLGKRISSIETPLEYLNFYGENVRKDLNPSPSIDPNLEHVPRSIDRIAIADGHSCFEWVLSYDYFDPTNGNNIPFADDIRLRLNSVFQRECDASTGENPYQFTYESPELIPSRLNKAVDHWGFYNGALENNNHQPSIPETDINGIVRGQSNRESDAELMKVGVLNKITYPTGGTTFFSFEANTKWEEGIQKVGIVSGLQVADDCTEPPSAEEVEQIVNMTAEELQNAQFRIYNESDLQNPSNPCTLGTPSIVSLSIYELSTGTLMGSYQLNLNPNQQSSVEHTADLSTIATLSASVDYRFVLSAFGGYGLFDLWAQIPYGYNKPVGGLRIQEIRNSTQSTPTANDVVKSYSYAQANAPEKSSATQVAMPVYGYSLMDNTGCDIVQFSEVSLVPLGSFEGYHIGYDRVVESLNGIGQNIYTFLSAYAPPPLDVFPYPPTRAYVNNGNLLTETSHSESGGVVKSTANTYVAPTYENMAGICLKIQRHSTAGIGGPCYSHSEYQPRTSRNRIKTIVSSIDGVSTTTDYEYDFEDRFGGAVKVSFDNSDGKLYETEHRYIHDYRACSSVKERMLLQNRIGRPYQTLSKVDGITIGGSKTIFEFF